MKKCIFLGPTLRLDRVPEEFDVYGPAALGSIYRAVHHGYSRIGIIDGVFGVVPSVWHKEILYAIENGASVYGASSLGALRAAELYPYGMRGVGWIFRMFRSGALTDDDEVAVTHGPAEVAFSPLSEPMVNFRATLRRMRRAGLLSSDEVNAACEHFKQVFYAGRTLDALSAYLRERTIVADPEAALRDCYLDVKAEDAGKLLHEMKTGPATEPDERLWEFLPTRFWSSQFESLLDDVPHLEPRRTGGQGPTSKSASSPPS